MTRVYSEEARIENVATRIDGQEFLLTVLTIPWRHLFQKLSYKKEEKQ